MDNILGENYTLKSGVKIPCLGLGTWQMSDVEAEKAVRAAISLGYRQIDTAAAYGNEGAVGRALSACGKPRDELFITTKIPAEIKTAEGAANSIERSLELLRTDHIDLLLIHAPMPWDEICGRAPRPDHRYERQNIAVWKVMESYVKRGKVRAIGLSNFENEDILNIASAAEIAPDVNQVRCHIGNTPRNALDFCKTHNILVQAYSPNATGRLLNDRDIEAVADKYGVSVPQLAIKYDLQLGTQPLPKTANAAHLAQNARLDFVISPEDMRLLEQKGVVAKVREG